MKSILIIMITLALFAGLTFAAPPFSTDLALNSTNATADFELAEPVQPTVLRLFGVKPLPNTVTVSRVHGNYTETLATLIVSTSSITASTNLTSPPWILLGDSVRLAGPTNAVLEFQGNR